MNDETFVNVFFFLAFDHNYHKFTIPQNIRKFFSVFSGL